MSYNVRGREIILSGESSKKFSASAKCPSSGVMVKRDAYFSKIDKSLQIEKRGQRVIVRTER